MSASGQLPNQPPQTPESPQEPNKPQAARDGQATGTSGTVLPGLEKALDALFKAHDHLNTAADRGGDGLSKMLDGINHSLRLLERELSQLIYRLGNSK